MRRNIYIIAIGLVFSFSFLGCKKDKTYSYTEELDKLQVYLVKNNITTKPTASGLYYIETKAGIGPNPTTGTKVYVKYEGRLLDGTIFDASIYDFPFYLGTGSVIRGWDEGIGYMKEGGKATLIIPSFLGYGQQAMENIPAYSTLIFDVELKGLQK